MRLRFGNRTHDVADRDHSNVGTVSKVARRQRIAADLIKSVPWFLPWPEISRRRLGGGLVEGFLPLIDIRAMDDVVVRQRLNSSEDAGLRIRQGARKPS